MFCAVRCAIIIISVIIICFYLLFSNYSTYVFVVFFYVWILFCIFVFCVLCFSFVLCIVSPFAHSCLFPISAQVYRPLPPGGNPIAVNKYHIVYHLGEWARFSSVGIATRYRLDRPGIEYPVGARFSAPVQTVPGAHPASYTKGTGSFPGVKQPGRGVDHPPHLAPRLNKE